MARIWIMSDLHDDYSRMHLPVYAPPQDVEADVLVVAGDIAGRFSSMGRGWLEAQRSRLGMPIVVVPGNHCFWKASLDREVPKFREKLQVDGIHVLDGDAVEVAGVRFVGGSLWTDYAIWRGDITKGQLEGLAGMNDFRFIKTGTGTVRNRLRPHDLAAVHARHRRAIEATLAVPFDGPTIVVTHHAPSPQGLRYGKATEPLDAAYASDLESVIRRGKPDLWIHGHVHTRRDYQVADTLIVCNPRGYVGWRRMFGQGVLEEEHAGFDERLVVEVGRGFKPRFTSRTVEPPPVGERPRPVRKSVLGPAFAPPMPAPDPDPDLRPARRVGGAQDLPEPIAQAIIGIADEVDEDEPAPGRSP